MERVCFVLCLLSFFNFHCTRRFHLLVVALQMHLNVFYMASNMLMIHHIQYQTQLIQHLNHHLNQVQYQLMDQQEHQQNQIYMNGHFMVIIEHVIQNVYMKEMQHIKQRYINIILLIQQYQQMKQIVVQLQNQILMQLHVLQKYQNVIVIVVMKYVMQMVKMVIVVNLIVLEI